MLKKLGGGNYHFWHNGKRCGGLSIWCSEACAWISNVYIAEDKRGMGLGTKMMKECITLCRKTSKKASLTVVKGNEPALRVYQKVGFKVAKDFGDLLEMRMSLQ